MLSSLFFGLPHRHHLPRHVTGGLVVIAAADSTLRFLYLCSLSLSLPLSLFFSFRRAASPFRRHHRHQRHLISHVLPSPSQLRWCLITGDCASLSHPHLVRPSFSFLLLFTRREKHSFLFLDSRRCRHAPPTASPSSATSTRASPRRHLQLHPPPYLFLISQAEDEDPQSTASSR